MWIPAFAGMTAVFRFARWRGGRGCSSGARAANVRRGYPGAGSRRWGGKTRGAKDARRPLGPLRHSRPFRHSRESGNPEIVGIDSRFRGNDESIDFARLPPHRGEGGRWRVARSRTWSALDPPMGGDALIRRPGAKTCSRAMRGPMSGACACPCVPSVIPARPVRHSRGSGNPEAVGIDSRFRGNDGSIWRE